ncbi:MAG: cytochrome C oxidase subunit IV family protein [Myxococcales bacterium]|nr:cytochrome C oxidase subunit IV family protein [Myxococcales bacterium]
MSDHETAATEGHDSHEHGEHHIHPQSHYVRIWGILLVLLIISFVGPWTGIGFVVLITAFGIAFVKAYMVMKYFMHLDVEKPVVHYFLATSLVFMVLMFAGISPDVMNHEGTNWVNLAAEAEIERALAAQAAGGGHGHGEHGDDHGDGHDDGHGDDHEEGDHGGGGH